MVLSSGRQALVPSLSTSMANQNRSPFLPPSSRPQNPQAPFLIRAFPSLSRLPTSRMASTVPWASVQLTTATVSLVYSSPFAFMHRLEPRLPSMYNSLEHLTQTRHSLRAFPPPSRPHDLPPKRRLFRNMCWAHSDTSVSPWALPRQYGGHGPRRSVSTQRLLRHGLRPALPERHLPVQFR